MYDDFTYENFRRVQYEGGATFVPVCKHCGRFVKSDQTIRENEVTIAPGPNATCSKCGRVEMLFEGYL